MQLREALWALSKSSPTAVSTAGEIENEAHLRIKNYLYTEPAIERDFIDCLNRLDGKTLIFLSGSSGDGKSEILNRNSKHFDHIDFHLDATHAFSPNESAIDTLNTKLTAFKAGARSLVIGINIGMLANYEREGCDEHTDIRKAIRSFLDGNAPPEGFAFFDFEAYPKFSYSGERLVAEQFSTILRKVVEDDSANPIRDAFNQALGAKNEQTLISNYLLLRDRGVQRKIIELLFSVRVQFDQFITARMLLDFIYEILCNDSILVDALFSGGSNEILAALSNLDPAVKRTAVIDRFLLERQLHIADAELSKFIESCAKFKFPITLSPSQLLRLCFLLDGEGSLSEYPRKLSSEYSGSGEATFKSAWQAHALHSENSSQKKGLKDAYSKVLIPGLTRYANRHATELKKKQLFLSSHGGYHLAAPMELKPDIKAIELHSQNLSDIHEFEMMLLVNGHSLRAPINLNLFELLEDIVHGAYPNRFQRTTVVVLDEIISRVREIVSQTEKISITKGYRQFELELDDDDEIQVSGF